jgi:hypothetical protein
MWVQRLDFGNTLLRVGVISKLTVWNVAVRDEQHEVVEHLALGHGNTVALFAELEGDARG